MSRNSFSRVSPSFPYLSWKSMKAMVAYPFLIALDVVSSVDVEQRNDNNNMLQP